MKAKTLFICNGNVYRSRLAEAYLVSKGWDARSAGVAPQRDSNGPVSWVAMMILRQNDLIRFMSRDWKPLRNVDIDWAEKIIVFEQANLELAKMLLNRDIQAEVWEVPDVPDGTLLMGAEFRLIRAARKTFEVIKSKVDEYAKRTVA